MGSRVGTVKLPTSVTVVQIQEDFHQGQYRRAGMQLSSSRETANDSISYWTASILEQDINTRNLIVSEKKSISKHSRL
eukprot:462021-Pyramimonas_sp.AAC.1